MQRPRLALSVLVSATLCLPLVVGQPAAGTYLTRCNPGKVAAFEDIVLTNAGECCMWTFPGNATTAPGPLDRTGQCSDATEDIIDLSGKKINLINVPAVAFLDCGTPK